MTNKLRKALAELIALEDYTDSSDRGIAAWANARAALAEPAQPYECADGKPCIRLSGDTPTAKDIIWAHSQAAQRDPLLKLCLNCGVDSTGKWTHCFGCPNDPTTFKAQPAAQPLTEQQLWDEVKSVLPTAYAMAAQPLSDRWIPVSERLPQADGDLVAVLAHSPVEVGAAKWSEKYQNFTSQGGWFEQDEVTHWMPLPKLL